MTIHAPTKFYHDKPSHYQDMIHTWALGPSVQADFSNQMRLRVAAQRHQPRFLRVSPWNSFRTLNICLTKGTENFNWIGQSVMKIWMISGLRMCYLWGTCVFHMSGWPTDLHNVTLAPNRHLYLVENVLIIQQKSLLLYSPIDLIFAGELDIEYF